VLQYLEIILGALALYALLATLAWRFQDRIAFPSPRAPLPVPPPRGLEDAEPFTLTLRDGTRLVGWYLPPVHGEQEARGAPALLWFYGNGETIGAIWPVLRDFRPSGTAMIVVDYPGYGASEGRATEAALYEAADVAYATLVARAGIDPARVHVYGRSLGTVVATHVAISHAVAGLVLESPFTNALEMGRRHYALFPGFLLRLRLDNLDMIRRVRCPVLVFHGTEDWLVPLDMGRRVAAAAPGPVELVLIDGAGHNDTYAVGGTAYRDKVWAFLTAGS
jgi:pimeloyl-ACP methyl ester carboxylesterase